MIYVIFFLRGLRYTCYPLPAAACLAQALRLERGRLNVTVPEYGASDVLFTGL